MLIAESKVRKETIEHIIEMVKLKGKPSIPAPKTKKFEINLPYCSLEVLKPEMEGAKVDILSITENFGDSTYAPTDEEEIRFDGVRKVYNTSSSSEGLDGVHLEGIDLNIDSSARGHHREGSKLEKMDYARFEKLLLYAKRNL